MTVEVAQNDLAKLVRRALNGEELVIADKSAEAGVSAATIIQAEDIKQSNERKIGLFVTGVEYGNLHRALC